MTTSSAPAPTPGYTPPDIDNLGSGRTPPPLPTDEGGDIRDNDPGVPQPGAQQADYFGFGSTTTMLLDDGISYLELKVFNEGERADYQNKTTRAVRIHKGGDASINMVPGAEREALIKLAVVGWNLRRKGQPVPCNDTEKQKFYKSADPRLIDKIEKEIRTQNPWLLQDVSIEDIDKEIETLQELRATKIAEEEGKASSNDR